MVSCDCKRLFSKRETAWVAREVFRRTLIKQFLNFPRNSIYFPLTLIFDILKLRNNIYFKAYLNWNQFYFLSAFGSYLYSYVYSQCIAMTFVDFNRIHNLELHSSWAMTVEHIFMVNLLKSIFIPSQFFFAYSNNVFILSKWNSWIFPVGNEKQTKQHKNIVLCIKHKSHCSIMLIIISFVTKGFYYMVMPFVITLCQLSVRMKT